MSVSCRCGEYETCATCTGGYDHAMVATVPATYQPYFRGQLLEFQYGGEWRQAEVIKVASDGVHFRCGGTVWGTTDPASTLREMGSGPTAAIERECDAIKAMLVAKNKAYGNSVLEPIRIFATSNDTEQLHVRIDDKLSRLKRGHAMPDENRADTIRDLIGYLVLLLIAEKSS